MRKVSSGMAIGTGVEDVTVPVRPPVPMVGEPMPIPPVDPPMPIPPDGPPMPIPPPPVDRGPPTVRVVDVVPHLVCTSSSSSSTTK